MQLMPKKWSVFQHYKDRCPPWIKLHRDLLNDRAFMSLSTASKALAPLMWLLASEHKDGVFDASTEELEFRTRMSSSEISKAVKELISKGFFVVASATLADCNHGAIPERETEGETEAKRETDSRFAPLAELLSRGVDKQVADDFLTLRKAKRSALTKTAIDGISREADKAGVSFSDAVTVCVERSWQGFKAEWFTKDQPPQQPERTWL